jgi:predicted NAD/FAD-binding protein
MPPEAPAVRVAIVGSGIAGLAAAHHLRDIAEITLFESADYFGGHSHTTDITLPGLSGPVSFGVDTGFLVYNERTYPGLIKLLGELDVATAKSDMSFSVQVKQAHREGTLEWSGASLDTVFTQRSNLLRPAFLRMLRDLLRFNRITTAIARSNTESGMMQSLGDFLQEHDLSKEFREWYLLPMLGCIWSCPTDQMLQFPVATMIRFCHNHGLLQISNRPQWRTVAGGSRKYVQKIVDTLGDARLNCPVRRISRDTQGVLIDTGGNTERFDKVVLACHTDQALRLLAEPSADETAILGRIRYQPNRAILHTDASVLPSHRRAWAAWNYQRLADEHTQSSQVCLHYLLNKLQPLPVSQAVLVSLNPLLPIDAQKVLATFEYSHPVFDAAAIRAQSQIANLQGRQHSYFCGAWAGYGFHEDGLQSGMDVARRIAATRGASLGEEK